MIAEKKRRVVRLRSFEGLAARELAREIRRCQNAAKRLRRKQA
jgi:hypothetical protein